MSPDVRREVEAAIAQLGYVPNRAARALVTRRSDSIGLVITEPSGRLFSDPFFPRVLRGISLEVEKGQMVAVIVAPLVLALGLVLQVVVTRPSQRRTNGRELAAST